MFYTILGYVWQYVTNPKAIIALSIFVALIASYNTIPRNLFWALMAVYILGVVGSSVIVMKSRAKSWPKPSVKTPKPNTASRKTKKNYS